MWTYLYNEVMRYEHLVKDARLDRVYNFCVEDNNITGSLIDSNSPRNSFIQ